jgi:hypothetical protein
MLLNILHQPAPPGAALLYDEPVQKAPQKLVPALPVVFVFRISEERTQLRAADLEICKFQNFNNISIVQFKRDSQFFKNIVVNHITLLRTEAGY